MKEHEVIDKMIDQLINKGCATHCLEVSVMEGPCDDATFDQRFDRIMLTAKELCIKYNDHYPEMMAFTADGKMMSIGARFNTPEDSFAFSEFCKGYFKEKNVTSYYFISSAWTLENPTEEDKSTYKPGNIRKNPRSKEVLVIMARSYFESKLVNFQIKRNRKDKVKELIKCGEGKLDENCNFGNLLPEIKEA